MQIEASSLDEGMENAQSYAYHWFTPLNTIFNPHKIKIIL